MQRGRYKKPDQLPHFRINQQITAREVRLIGEDNKQIGVMTAPEAFQKARESGTDLVEIAPKAVPPVVKIIDFKKFLYLEAKKRSQQKKSAKKGEMKELRLKPFMADGDYQVRLKRVKEFIQDGHQVRIFVPLIGRQLAHKEFGFQLISRLVNDLGDSVKLDQEAKFIGRQVVATMSKK